MKQKNYWMRCKLSGENIGNGMCCFWCHDIVRPKDMTSDKMCEHEEILGEYYKKV